MMRMRFAAPASLALALTAGCLRFGYGDDPKRVDGGFDAGRGRLDGSTADAAADGGKVSDAGGRSMDAAVSSDAAGADAGTMRGDGGGNMLTDAGGMQDAGMQDAAAPDAGKRDAGMVGMMDAGMLDAGMLDAGMRDAGAIDAGMVDSGFVSEVDPRWTEDCPGMTGVLFCDDFEDNSFAKWSYPVETQGTTSVSTVQRHGGTYALRARTSASTSSVQSKARQGVKAYDHRMSGDLWARYWYYLPNTINVTDKFSIGVISEYEDPYFGFSVVIFPDGVGLERGATQKKVSSPTFPRNQWVCVEMHVVIHPSAGMFELYLDSQHITSMVSEDSLPDRGYTSFEVGVHYANFNQGAVTAYVDDVRLGTSRLGCN
jgi:hypothetical protein